MCLQNIPATSFVIDLLGSLVWASGLIPLLPEAITMTLSFFRSDKLVYTNALLRPISPCQPTQAMAGPVFSYLLNPHPGIQLFQAELTSFMDASNKSWSAQMRDSQISGSGPVQTTSSSTLWSSRG